MSKPAMATRAGNMTMSPWAKLITPVTLKMVV